MKKYSIETAVGFFVVIGLICVGYMTVKLGKVSLYGSDTYPLYARFISVTGLRPGTEVEIYGIRAGTVDSMSIDEQRQMAVVKLRIDKKISVFDDGAATIKTSGLIGDKFVTIDPGGAGEPLKPGSIITQTSTPPDIDDLIGKFAFGDVRKKPDKSRDDRSAGSKGGDT
jgi:phospholipid/cholesterol/gamma-HCH transport system substrate-binding protein